MFYHSQVEHANQKTVATIILRLAKSIAHQCLVIQSSTNSIQIVGYKHKEENNTQNHVHIAKKEIKERPGQPSKITLHIPEKQELQTEKQKKTQDGGQKKRKENTEQIERIGESERRGKNPN